MLIASGLVPSDPVGFWLGRFDEDTRRAHHAYFNRFILTIGIKLIAAILFLSETAVAFLTEFGWIGITVSSVRKEEAAMETLEQAWPRIRDS